jgi:hypothetical protein
MPELTLVILEKKRLAAESIRRDCHSASLTILALLLGRRYL